MLKFILMLLLATASSNASAEWVKVVSGKGDTVYADPSSIRKKGDKVKMWHMLDYKSAQQGGEKPFMSMKRHAEFDCNKHRYRFLYTVYFSENMGAGDSLGKDSTESKWMSLPLITSAQSLMKIACGKN